MTALLVIFSVVDKLEAEDDVHRYLCAQQVTIIRHVESCTGDP